MHHSKQCSHSCPDHSCSSRCNSKPSKHPRDPLHCLLLDRQVCLWVAELSRCLRVILPKHRHQLAQTWHHMLSRLPLLISHLHLSLRLPDHSLMRQQSLLYSSSSSQPKWNSSSFVLLLLLFCTRYSCTYGRLMGHAGSPPSFDIGLPLVL